MQEPSDFVAPKVTVDEINLDESSSWAQEFALTDLPGLKRIEILVGSSPDGVPAYVRIWLTVCSSKTYGYRTEFLGGVFDRGPFPEWRILNTSQHGNGYYFGRPPDDRGVLVSWGANADGELSTLYYEFPLPDRGVIPDDPISKGTPLADLAPEQRINFHPLWQAARTGRTDVLLRPVPDLIIRDGQWAAVARLMRSADYYWRSRKR